VGVNPLRAKRSRAVWLAAITLAVFACCTGLAAPDTSRRLAERGPPTLVVGALFTLAAPPALLIAMVRGQPLRLAACRLEHGLIMVGASVVVLPTGLLLAPFHWQRLPGAWMDGVVDAVQEDYCSRPVTTVLP
jgi:hypothetical protein